VVVFGMDDPGHRVDEGQGLVIVAEGEARQLAAVDLPVGQGGQVAAMAASSSAAMGWTLREAARVLAVMLMGFSCGGSPPLMQKFSGCPLRGAGRCTMGAMAACRCWMRTLAGGCES
jgi:hypothetical protein